MLSASVSGDIFASPSARQVLSAIRLGTADHRLESSNEQEDRASKTLDALLIVNNYTGDRLNFGLAAERALSEGIRVESVIVADDVSLLSRPSLVGARGLAGNIIVCKILGAAAAKGMVLEELKRLGDAVVGSLKSVGASLDHCHVPGRPISKEDGAVGEGEYELGMGLHNEPGVKRLSLESGERMVEQMLDLVLKASCGIVSNQETKSVPATIELRKDTTVLYVNNLGGVSQLEMGAVVDEVVSQLGVSTS
jgi:dihydroxyacetone kinase